MASKGGRRKRSGGYKYIVARHGKGSKRNCNAAEKAIETRERRDGANEGSEQLSGMSDDAPIRFYWQED